MSERTAQLLKTVFVLLCAAMLVLWQNSTEGTHKASAKARSHHVAQRQKPKHQRKPEPIRPDVTLPVSSDGVAPVISKVDTAEPVVFLTIDDGAYKDPSELVQLERHGISATLFLADLFIHDNPQFFTRFMHHGMPIENHTLDHVMLDELSYDEQVAQICGGADKLAEYFGKRPTLFRPPGGRYNYDTQRAAAACGMKAIIIWSAKANGGSMQYQVGEELLPGDIVLMHFRPEFSADLSAFIAAQKAAGLQTVLLQDWFADAAQ